MPDEIRFHGPPTPSTPREAPWREIEDLTLKLDQLTSILTGGIPQAPLINELIKKLDELINIIKSGPAPSIPELPITSRLDIANANLVMFNTKIDTIIRRLEAGQMRQIKPGQFQYVAVTNVSAIVLDEEPARRYTLLINDSDTDIYLSLGREAILHSGICLSPYGGFYEINFLNPYTGKIYGICNATSKNMLLTEAI